MSHEGLCDQVRTTVHQGSLEVHIFPWVRVSNETKWPVTVRADSSDKGQAVESGGEARHFLPQKEALKNFLRAFERWISGPTAATSRWEQLLFFISSVCGGMRCSSR